jgi:hypothetical protein
MNLQWKISTSRFLRDVIYQHLNNVKIPSLSAYDDILLNPSIQIHPELFLSSKITKQLQMKVGGVWQDVLGGLGKGTCSLNKGGKIDIVGPTFVCELKNRYNTMNSDSAHSVFMKLKTAGKRYQRQPILCIINPKSSIKAENTLKTYNKRDLELTYRLITGREVFKYILGHLTEEQIDYIITMTRRYFVKATSRHLQRIKRIGSA